MTVVSGRLAEILDDVREDLHRRRRAGIDVAALEQAALTAPPVRSLAGALTEPGTRVIAEVKRRSPSRGDLAPEGIDPVAQAAAYAGAGAAAVSVLTEPRHFRGSLADLAAVRADGIAVPVMRKDFIIDELQLLEARAAGADAVLLIAGVLDGPRLGRLLARTEQLGMEALVEAHDRRDLELAIASGARVLGVNNRNLASFETSLKTTVELAALVPDDRVLVSESGISGPDDVRMLRECAGVRALLVGEALMRADDPAAVLAGLVAA